MKGAFGGSLPGPVVSASLLFTWEVLESFPAILEAGRFQK